MPLCGSLDSLETANDWTKTEVCPAGVTGKKEKHHTHFHDLLS